MLLDVVVTQCRLMMMLLDVASIVTYCRLSCYSVSSPLLLDVALLLLDVVYFLLYHALLLTYRVPKMFKNIKYKKKKKVFNAFSLFCRFNVVNLTREVILTYGTKPSCSSSQ